MRPLILIKHREYKPYDKAANARMDEELYHKRSLAETVNSVIKREYEDSVSSRVGCGIANSERLWRSVWYTMWSGR